MASAQGFGWIVRRTGEPSILTQFYRDTLGLPVLREWDQGADKGGMLHAGGYSVLETNVLDDSISPPASLEEARCIPVFASADVAAAVNRIESAGTSRFRDQPLEDVEFWRDPDGFPFGLMQADNDDSVSITLDGQVAPSCTLREMIQFVASTPSDAVQNYATLFGLASSSNDSLDVGMGQTVRFVETSKEIPAISDRKQSACVWIVRVYDFEHFAKLCEGAGLTPLNAMRFKGGQLDYYLDQGNSMFGFQERFAPDPDLPTTLLAEDVAARQDMSGRAVSAST